MEMLSNAIDSHIMEYQSKLHLPHIEFWHTNFPSFLDDAFPYVEGHSAWMPYSNDFSKYNLLVSKSERYKYIYKHIS
jgi:hypothetical protein